MRFVPQRFVYWKFGVEVAETLREGTYWKRRDLVEGN
jgi:hypothetical protein